MQRDEFAKQIRFMAEVCNKSLTDNIISFYYSRLKYVPDEVLKEALAVFAERGHFPTCGAVLRECGFEELPDRETRQARVENSSQPDIPTWPEVKRGEELKKFLKNEYVEFQRPVEKIKDVCAEFERNCKEINVTVERQWEKEGWLDYQHGRRNAKMRVYSVMYRVVPPKRERAPGEQIPTSIAELMALLPPSMRSKRIDK
jgi:hypothetical protein